MSAAMIREAAVRIIKSIAGKNRYTNGGNREKVLDGWGDCSSTVRKVLEKAGLKFKIGSNTNEQVRNRRILGIVVDQTTTGYPNEANLKPGDCLYFKGNIFHALRVGHVEMYTGKNECYGHGSGIGPKKHTLRDYCHSRISKLTRYFMAIRWAWDLGERDLRKGSEGGDVLAVQTMLIELDYNLGKDGADGVFGPVTLARVIQFQERAGLPVTGVLNEASIKKLQEISQTGWPTNPKPPVEPNPTPAKDYMTLWAQATSSVNVRTGPGTQHAARIQLRKGASLMYDGKTEGGWYAVLYEGKRHWVSGAHSKLVMQPKYIVDLSEYDVITDEKLFCSYLSFVWVRIGLRSQTSNGPLVMDKKAAKHATMLRRYNVPFDFYVYGRGKDANAGALEADAAMAWGEKYGPLGYMYDAEAGTVTHETIQGFVDRIETGSGKRCGAYIGHHLYRRFKGDQLRLAYRMIPRYGKNKAVDMIDPDFQHDIHQFTSVAHIPGKEDHTDMSHLSGTGCTIEWLRGEPEEV